MGIRTPREEEEEEENLLVWNIPSILYGQASDYIELSFFCHVLFGAPYLCETVAVLLEDIIHC